jgi:hypothetical protein
MQSQTDHGLSASGASDGPTGDRPHDERRQSVGGMILTEKSEVSEENPVPGPLSHHSRRLKCRKFRAQRNTCRRYNRQQCRYCRNTVWCVYLPQQVSQNEVYTMHCYMQYGTPNCLQCATPIQYAQLIPGKGLPSTQICFTLLNVLEIPPEDNLITQAETGR